MFNTIPESTPYTPEQNRPAGNCPLSLCSADIPDQMVISAVDAIIARMAPAYLELMREAKEKPEIISDYKSSLYDSYKDMSLTPEIRMEVMEAQEIASGCNVVKKKLPSSEISVFSEKNGEFNENQALDKARLNIKFKVSVKDIKEEDALDRLLSQLRKKILSRGYGDGGTFDIRFEKGCMSLERSSWKWHFDGEIFKTSVTVCYSNKKNWSTQVSGPKPADHGFLYDAQKVLHRAPIPSDLEGEELNADDYRLFIRYNEFYKEGEGPFADRCAPKKKEKIPPLIPNYEPISKISLIDEEKRYVSNWVESAKKNHIDNLMSKYSKIANLPQVIILDTPKSNFSELFSKLEIPKLTPIDMTSLLSPIIYEKDHAEDPKKK